MEAARVDIGHKQHVSIFLARRQRRGEKGYESATAIGGDYRLAEIRGARPLGILVSVFRMGIAQSGQREQARWRFDRGLQQEANSE